MVVLNNQDTKVLVTGASGFLATHCVKQLLDAGYHVRGTVRSLQNFKKVQPLRGLQYANERLELVEADLENHESWRLAVKDCQYVLHVASPIPLVPDESIIPVAINGTLAVLKACAKEPSVKKVVLTSSCVAVSEGHNDENHVFTEEDWSLTDPKKVSYYPRSKTEAEKAAWNFVKNISDMDNKFALTCINPSVIIGPALVDIEGFSMSVIKRFLTNELPAIPRLNVPMVDVRDVAKAHILAMTNPASDGHRIITTYQPSLWFKDVARALSKEFKPQGYTIPHIQAPNFLICIFSMFDSQVKQVLPRIGKEEKFDNSKARNLLGLQFRNPETSLVEMAYSMIERGIVPKKPGYKRRDFDY